MAAEDEVRQASERFYAALNRALEESDTGPMGEIWSHGSDVSAMHPFGGRMDHTDFSPEVAQATGM
jgi:hypothetical protein